MVEPHPRGTRACRLGDQDPLLHDCFYLAPFFIILWTHLGFKRRRRRRRIRILPQFGTLRPRIQLPIGRRFRFPHRFQRSRPHRRRRRRRWRRRSGSRRFHDREERERKRITVLRPQTVSLERAGPFAAQGLDADPKGTLAESPSVVVLRRETALPSPARAEQFLRQLCGSLRV